MEDFDLWELISVLCQKVCEEQNVFLDIFVEPGHVELQLMPMDEDWDEEEDE